eukprot:410487-Heterocapsa_arctica.AAC.1
MEKNLVDDKNVMEKNLVDDKNVMEKNRIILRRQVPVGRRRECWSRARRRKALSRLGQKLPP